MQGLPLFAPGKGIAKPSARPYLTQRVGKRLTVSALFRPPGGPESVQNCSHPNLSRGDQHPAMVDLLHRRQEERQRDQHHPALGRLCDRKKDAWKRSREVEKSHLGRSRMCDSRRLNLGKFDMADVKAESGPTSKYAGASSATTRALLDWPAVVLGVAGLCTVAWSLFLVWLAIYLVSLAFA
jgi:hypothetical protein